MRLKGRTSIPVRRIAMSLSAIALVLSVFSDRIQSRAPVATVGLHQHGTHGASKQHIGQRPQPLQAQQSALAAKSNLHLPLAVDGSKNPERVPDRIAFNHFIGFNAESATPTTSEIDRRTGSLARIGLSQEDHRVLVELLKGVKDELKQAEATAKGASHDRAAAKIRRDATLLRVRTRLQTDLSPDGIARVNQYIRTIKSKIRIYGVAPSE